MSMEKAGTDKTARAANIRRLRRIEGQVRGIARMIEDERYCIDILHQMQAIKAALSRVEDAVLSDHAASCVESAIEAGDAAGQREKFSELVALMSRVKR
jgi:DNA-binding FrmR family transcriptional regulator